MNQTIRKRIEDINNGIVPEGYKQTPFGIFPCDWETDKKLNDLGAFDKGKGLPGDKMTDEGVPCIGYGDIYMKYNYHFEKAQNFVDEKTASESQPIEKGTLLFTGTGETAEEIGKCVCYNGDETIYAGGDIILFNSKEVNPLFLAYQQYQDFSLKRKAMFGQGHSVVHIQRGELAKLYTAFPKDKTEQGKIAEILMKWDEMVELQEQYIQKLEFRKKAIMKKLLTPKDGWEKCKLKKFIKVKSGYAFKSETYVEQGKYKILTIKNVQKGVLDFSEISTINELPRNIQKHQILNINDIIISLTGNVGRSCYITKGNCLLNQRVGKIESSNEYKQFVYAILQSDNFINAMINIAQGGAQANLSNEDVENFEFFVPFINEEFDKRTIYKIGQINLTIDEDISLQKEKLVKIKEQRKAMQQYLLTGIVMVG